MSAPRRVRVRAPAKVNLFLEVRGRRGDGYHEVESLLAAVDLADVVGVERVPRGALERGEPAERSEPVRLALRDAGALTADVPGDARNLAVRAAALAHRRAAELGRPEARDALALELEKRVPSGAGLGGGSSDAAAALLGAALVLGLDPDDGELRAGLARLGSDCSFFLAARRTGLALCRGRGELVEELSAPPVPWTRRVVALLAPALVVPTAGVYGALEPPREPRPCPRVTAFADPSLARARAALFDRLEPAALAVHPALARWRELLDEAGQGHFVLSGSGSSFFSLFDDARLAAAVLEELAMRAKARDLGLRGRWVLRFAGRGATPFGPDPDAGR